jgi:hypothetical protein
MITIKLKGGLGNQMFQYALARHLAIKNNTEVALDLTFINHRLPFVDYTFRNFELDIFNIKCKKTFLSKYPISLKNIAFILQTISNKTKKIFYPNKYIKERQLYVFDEKILNTTDNSYLDGYWQNVKYFKDIEPIIQKEFSDFTSPLSDNGEKTIGEIKKANSVCINFRRVDYINTPATKAFYGVVELDYYREAIKNILIKIDSPHFFIFSDDIEWCQKNFKSDYPTTFITKDKSNSSIEDFRLMCACKNYIIPNSTFAWWAAWLNQSKEKTVIAPKKWIADSKVNADDFVPKEWVRI